jgi:PPM family protein phosphatase
MAMSANLSLHPGNAQWIGQRAEQQDAFGFLGCEARGGPQTGDVLVVLADGMGGLHRGGEASRLAVRTFLDHFTPAGPSTKTPLTATLTQALDAANQAVNTLARDTDGEGEVGTTLIAAAVRKGRLHWIGVGDSRLYLYRAADGSLTPATTRTTWNNSSGRASSPAN